MVRITRYSITPSSLVVDVEYEYDFTDPVTSEVLTRRGTAALEDGAGSLADPNWGDAELCTGLGALLNQAVEIGQGA